jgi:hypothetical protein
MAHVVCPWCEADLILAVGDTDNGECPECLTRWSYEDAPRDDALPLAA